MDSFGVNLSFILAVFERRRPIWAHVLRYLNRFIVKYVIYLSQKSYKYFFEDQSYKTKALEMYILNRYQSLLSCNIFAFSPITCRKLVQ